MAIAETSWDPKQSLIHTRISGDADMHTVNEWKRSLMQALDRVEDNGTFKIFVNLHGFKAVNFDVHKEFRVIIPSILAEYGWRVGYLDMFPEATIELKNKRGIQCIAAVHVHDDETKINNYDSNFSRPVERFFTDPAIAGEWIEQVGIK